jgi:hypothetical protein
MAWGAAASLHVLLVSGRPNSDTLQDKRASVSVDGGDSWLPSVSIANDRRAVYEAAATYGHFLLLQDQAVSHIAHWYCASSDDAGQIWNPAMELPGQPLAAHLSAGSIAGDTTSETALVLSVGTLNDYSGADLYLHRTTDGGQSWQAPQALTTDAPLFYLALPEILCAGKLWAVVWQDRGDHLLYWRFSANHGRNWYPRQFVTDPEGWALHTWGQFVGNEARVYWDAATDSSCDYRNPTGIITPDTIRPNLVMSLLPVDTIHTGDTVYFDATATDNDTLSAVRVLIADSAGPCTTLVLSDAGGHVYRGALILPHDGIFRYRGEAEDFWENVAASPDSGWISFFVESPNRASTRCPYPSFFAVSVFPNPSNGWPRIQLSPEWFAHGAVTVAVYNVLGQKVRDDRLMSAGMKAMQSAPTTYEPISECYLGRS